MSTDNYMPTITEENYAASAAAAAAAAAAVNNTVAVAVKPHVIGTSKFPDPVQSLNILTQAEPMQSKSFGVGSMSSSSQTTSSSTASSGSWNEEEDCELNKHFPTRHFNLFVGTWNMQRCKVPNKIGDFILPSTYGVSDVYVIGIQEAPSDIKNWEIRLQETLGPSHALAHSSSHGVLHISIFVKRDLIWYCSDFAECKITTRPISQIKTKGAIGISMKFFGSTFLFLNSHFHSGQTKTNERIEDYRKITDELKISKTNKNQNHSRRTKTFDGVFWFGDLNFRISQPHQHLKDEIANCTYDINEMLKCDQLTCNMKRGKLFRDYQEATIRFLPTYKFAANSDHYDTSKKFRVPSYTDRILFRSSNPTTIEYLDYNSVPKLRHSDHRPVYGMFSVVVKPAKKGTARNYCGKFNQQVYKEASSTSRRSSHTKQPSHTSMICTIL